MSAKDDQMQQGKSAANCSPALGSAFRWQLFNENQRVELPDKSVARVVEATCNCPACGHRGLPRRGAEFDSEWRCGECLIVWVPERHYLVIGIPRSDAPTATELLSRADEMLARAHIMLDGWQQAVEWHQDYERFSKPNK